MRSRKALHRANKIIVKIGSSLLTAGGQGLDHAALTHWADQIAALWDEGRQTLLVSSGAVAEGMARLGWRRRPQQLNLLQAAAAVGQAGLVQAYESQFQRHGRRSAQILLTHEDLGHRQRYLNARSTLATLLEYGVVPIVNENDTVVIDEIRFGDNDTLAALVANLIEAELLVILTDQPGLFDRDPRDDPEARLIAEASVNDPVLDQAAGESRSGLGRGGMITKIRAARLAARSGTATVIADGKTPNVLQRLLAGEPLGTFLIPDCEPLDARKRWLVGQRQLKGKLWLDAGAVTALQTQGKSLLPVGVKRLEGDFRRGDVVACLDPEGREIARGLVNYAAEEVRRIQGCSSRHIAEVLGYVDEPELIHRDNLVLL
ncbi:glutamate 5-kinase [Methylomarinovum caldicuralii]|uniref:Glutamate 5-kinase n=1 Tax=Methylomarinovum caldicuralii TaxID=438856 RepID=A0AAU9C5A7_9GAMM|nr:glutamate 5-kinase [Methylomarinovum caldicuralii]BCX81089.1 glutamate 5-kinase [Methylomarinovum caldicuralii]